VSGVNESNARPELRPQPDEVAVMSDVHKRFGDRQVLQGVDLIVPPGKITVVLGGSGSGKSTILRIVLGLESYDSGSVRLLGREMNQLSPRGSSELMMEVGVLFQFGALFDSMTVGDNVGFALRHVQKRPDWAGEEGWASSQPAVARNVA
jgi:phospholipid/cholesterol/gamma-HCH transport system ATP-binding protein